MSEQNEPLNSVKAESKLMAKHSIVYGAGNMLTKVIGFLMIPIYTRYLVPAEYGTLELVGMTTEIIGMLLSMRISRAMYRFYFEYDSQKDKNEVISTGNPGIQCGRGHWFVAGISFSSYLSKWLLDTREFGYYFIISFTSLWFETTVLMAFYYLQITKKSVKYIILSSLRLVVSLFLTYI